jgi:excisionase family DNA binding protein
MAAKIFRRCPDIVTVGQLCKMLNIGRNTAYALLQSGQIKSARIGGKYAIPTKWVEDYLKANCR